MPPTKQISVRDHTPLEVNTFKGGFNRGVEDNTPLGYQIDSLNVFYAQNEIASRFGFTKDYTVPDIRRIAIYKRINEASRYLILDKNGQFFDSLFPGTPLITNAAFLDFSTVSYLNRCYITFHNGVTGISGSKVYVYQGAGPGTLRFASGAAPSGFTITAADSASSGNIEVGTHLIAVAYLSDSGFLSAPGPELFTVYNAPGGKKVDLSGVHAGPTGTVARVLLATQVIVNYDGNQVGYEFFFVPNGTINDNVTTTITLDFFDSDLVDSADYLFDNRSSIPAGLGIGIYQGRMTLWGVPGFENYVFVSKADDIENFDETSGVLFIDPSSMSSSIQNCIEQRKSLYIFNKEKCWSTVDNGSDPNTWGIDPVDKGVGTVINGIGRILDERSANTDRYFVANAEGLFVFETGVFRRPEVSWLYNDVWKRINATHLNLMQVEHDHSNYTIYIAVPLDNATINSHILVCDYSNAINVYSYIDYTKLRWSMWTCAWGSIASITVDYVSSRSALRVAGYAGNIYRYDESVVKDDSIDYPSNYESHLFYQNPGYEHHFGFLTLQAQGSASVAISLNSKNNVKTGSGRTIVLASGPATAVRRKINFISNKMKIKLSTTSGRFVISYMAVDCKPWWLEVPTN